MSLVAGSVSATLNLDANPYRQGFLQASALMQTFPSLVTNFMASPMLGLVGVASTAMNGVAAAIRGGVSLIISAFNDSLDQADKIHDMAINVGVAAEALSGLGLAAQQSGSSTEAVADAFKFLGRNVAEAMQGSKEQAQLFQQMGVSITEAGGSARGLEAIMLDVADALAGTDDAGRRTQIAMGLLGRSGSDLLATLTQGSAALREQIATFRDYGAVVTDEAANSADAFGDVLGEFKIAWQGIKNQLAEPLRDNLLPMLQGWLEWLRSNQDQVKSVVRGIADFVIAQVQNMISAVANLGKIIKDTLIGGTLGAIGGGIAGGFLAGPGGILPGIQLGGLAGSAITGAASYSISPTIQIVPSREKSDSQIGREVREAWEGATARFTQERSRSIAQQRINSGF